MRARGAPDDPASGACSRWRGLGRLVACLVTALALVLPGAPAVGGTRVGSPPAALTLTVSPAPGSIWLSWKAADTPIQQLRRYTIYRGTAADSLVGYETLSPGRQPELTYSDQKVTADARYFYAVTATNGEGESPRSAVVSAVPGAVGVLFASNRWSGTGARDLGFLAPDGTATRLTDDGGDHDTPAIAADGTLAYTSDSGNAPSDYDLWVKRPGEAPLRITTGADYSDGEPAFSPDGRTIAFTRIPVAGAPTVWTIPARGGRATQVPGATSDASPAWAPSGRLLALTHLGPQKLSIVITNVSGTYRRPLVGEGDDAYDAHDPSWAADGRKISFIRTDATSSVVAWLDHQGGSKATVVSPLTIKVVAQHAGPGGNRIAFEGRSATSDSTLWEVSWGGSQPKALGTTDTGAAASPAIAEVPGAYVPNAVAGLAMRAGISSGAVSLTWVLHAGGSAADCRSCPQWIVVRRSEAGANYAPDSPETGIPVYEGKATSTTVRGLRNGGRYLFAAFSIGGLGDASAGVQAAAQPAAPPKVSPNGTALASLSAGGPRFTASFGRPLPEGSRYVVEIGTRPYNAASKTWAAPAFAPFTNGAATTKVVPAKAGTTYHLRARILDFAGNPTAWGPVSVVPVPYDDRAFTTTGKWTALTKQNGRFGSTLRESKKAGSTLKLAAHGSRFALIADRCKACGAVKVYVDGRLSATVDTYAKTTSVRRQVWSKTFKTIGRHTITVKVVGTPKRQTVRVDGLTVRR